MPTNTSNTQMPNQSKAASADKPEPRWAYLRRWPTAAPWAIAGLALFVALILFFNRAEKQWKDSSGGSGGGAPMAAPPANVESMTAAIAHQEARALAESRIARFREQVESVRKAIAELDKTIGEWERRSKELLANDQGRLIASDSNAVTTFKALLDAPRPSRSRVDSARASIIALVGPVEDAAKRPESIWAPEKSAAEMDALALDVSRTLEVYRGLVRSLDLLASNAAKVGKAADTTLATAIDRLNAERAIAHATAVKRVEDEGRMEREAKEVADAKERNRLSHLAHDKEALNLLSFTGLNGEGRPWSTCGAGRAYAEFGYFQEMAVQTIQIRLGKYVVGIYSREGVEEVARRNTIAQQKYGLSLHALFKVVVLSEAIQAKLTTEEQLRQSMRAAENRGDNDAAAQIAALLKYAGQLPKPKYP